MLNTQLYCNLRFYEQWECIVKLNIVGLEFGILQSLIRVEDKTKIKPGVIKRQVLFLWDCDCLFSSYNTDTSINQWKNTEYIEQYFQKDFLILLEDSIRAETYKDNDGKSHTVIKVIADRVSFVGSKKDSNNSINAPTDRQSAAKESSEPEFEMTEYEEDDLPF